MANRFLRLMEERGERSQAALKRLYRAACKRVHPDAIAPGGPSDGGQAFLTIRAEYEEARAALLEAPAGPPGRIIRGRPSPPSDLGARPAGRPMGSRGKGSVPGPARGPDGSPVCAPAAEAHTERGREPGALAAFRDACARFGRSTKAMGDDAYRWKPSIESVTELLILANALAAERLQAELSALETLLSSLVARYAELLRYPGVMTRVKILYSAFSHWAEWRDGWTDDRLAACRTRLLDLENPTATLVKSQAVADVTDAFPGAARFLRIAWGIAGDVVAPEDTRI